MTLRLIKDAADLARDRNASALKRVKRRTGVFADITLDKPILRTYVPGYNIPRMKRPNNQDLPIELDQEKDSTSKPKNVDLQMASQNSAAISIRDESDEFKGIQLTQKQKSMLRKKWRNSCDKQAAKTCKKACDNARKRACDDFHCKKSISKSFKKHCKSSCKHFFLGTRSISNEISD
ncbi:hypothetical protein RR48_07115 [Papilio machaon]|uniref:Uncharacterized protein n=1 Tax=Papilio machaon TaxID=76193 RepID=A0A194RJ96_PAPMA|nr:hypothetical protein RR48_07115 [Papilio machaon]